MPNGLIKEGFSHNLGSKICQSRDYEKTFNSSIFNELMHDVEEEIAQKMQTPVSSLWTTTEDLFRD